VHFALPQYRNLAPGQVSCAGRGSSQAGQVRSPSLYAFIVKLSFIFFVLPQPSSRREILPLAYPADRSLWSVSQCAIALNQSINVPRIEPFIPCNSDGRNLPSGDHLLQILRTNVEYLDHLSPRQQTARALTTPFASSLERSVASQVQPCIRFS
jgi:hypothetical protein